MDFQLSSEQRMLKQMARDLAEKEFRPQAARWDENAEFPLENRRRLAELGLLGILIPKEYGGGGRDLIDMYIVVEELARVCLNTTVLVHSMNATPRVIQMFGSEEQKQKYLPGFARGDLITSIAMTEPDAGSALTDLTTTAKLDGDQYVINGRKCFISAADIADVLLVFARFAPTKGARGIGTILVDKGTAGYHVPKKEKKMGARGMNECEVVFEDCRVPAANVVVRGEPDSSIGLVKGLGVWNGMRVGVGVMGVGMAQGALDEAMKYAQQRQQFGRYLAEFQGLQWMLADMAIKIEAGRWLCYRALVNAKNGLVDGHESAIAKAYAAEMCQQVLYDALQFFGGYGYTREFPLERMVRDARYFTIAAGTTQVLKNQIAQTLLGRKIAQRA